MILTCMPSLATIPFRRIPHHSEIFLDYLDLSPAALRFYARPPSLESLESAAHQICARFQTPRRQIARVLKRQNEGFGSSPRTMQYIRDLEDDRCVAVVTGQQVGLFTGPLYTPYKALTAIRIAEELRARGVPAVPLFWMDSEDHDLAEVTRVWVLERGSAPRMIDYCPILFGENRDEDVSRPVGSISFGESIENAVEQYVEFLPESPRNESIRALLQQAYRRGATFTQAFASLMVHLFRNHGLILFDSSDQEAKPLVSGTFQRALRECAGICEALRSRDIALEEAGYHTQVHVAENSTVLFVHDQGQRRALARADEGFALKNCSRNFTTDELARLAAESPERFSPNVLLRPIVQDTLFPTVAYVAGPSEIAYFAQIQVLYDFFDRPMPAIWPRASFTVVEQEVSRSMREHGVAFEDCLMGKHHIVEKIIAAKDQTSATAILRGLQEYLEEALDALHPGLVAAEASLGPALDTARRKILHHVAGLQTKLVHVEARHHHEVLEKAEYFLNHCYPNRNLQERAWGVLYLLASQGETVLDLLYSSIRPGAFDHKIVTLD